MAKDASSSQCDVNEAYKGQYTEKWGHDYKKWGPDTNKMIARIQKISQNTKWGIEYRKWVPEYKIRARIQNDGQNTENGGLNIKNEGQNIENEVQYIQKIIELWSFITILIYRNFVSLDGESIQHL